MRKLLTPHTIDADGNVSVTSTTILRADYLAEELDIAVAKTFGWTETITNEEGEIVENPLHPIDAYVTWQKLQAETMAMDISRQRKHAITEAELKQQFRG